MPCYDPYTDPHRRDLPGEPDPLLVSRLNTATRLLCSLCRELEAAGWDEAMFHSIDPDLPAWWTAHKADDERRRDA